MSKFSQPLQSLTVKCPKNIPLSLEHVDAWMTSVLDIEIDSSLCIFTMSEEKFKHPFAFMWRVLLLSRVLLQSIRIPVFDPGDIVTIDDTHREYYSVTVALPYINHIPEKIYIHTLKTVVDLLLRFMKNPITSQNIEILFSILQKDFITPLLSVSGSGKSTMPLLTEAYHQNIPFIHLGNGVYNLGLGSKGKQFNRSASVFDSAIGQMLSHNKVASANLLRQAGLPAPIHQIARSQEEALRVAEMLGWPLVVKPVDQDRGEGVSIDVSNPHMLKEAFSIATKASLSKQIIIERQVEGVCCRIFIVGDTMLYAVKRLPKSVRGDGKNSVKALIEKANHKEKSLPPWKRSERFPLDAVSIEAMGIAGFSLESIPKENQLVPLRKIESTQWGGVDEDVSQLIHLENIDLAVRSAKLFNLKVAGIDIITPDITVPWYQNAAIINEVNFSPQYGGGEISRRTIPSYLKYFIEEDGRIPITVIVGGTSAWKYAKEMQAKAFTHGLQCFITDHKTSISSREEEVHFTFKDLYRRCKALLLDVRVDALVIVVDSDEFLYTGLPIDKIDQVITTSQKLYDYSDGSKALSPSRVKEVMALLQSIM